ncbi:hypothetical protein O0L34_g488 [Tuta absoluta]|nr:hypothetical protein O0L34_g488 [Tuta absoluta]
MFDTLFVLILPASVYGIGQPHYECGENGRFEYCIDFTPGCIVGCHCHPGYYFDTETKICEPNAKMLLEFRRQFSGPLPTRVPDLILPVNELDLEPTPTTTSTLVDITAKESDDLGDWLYNQFFKTIESQVINGTNSTDNPMPESRRSYREPSFKKKRQKTSKSKRAKRRRKELRRKMLRITEDDSMFDESSSGTSSSDESSGTSDSSSSDSSSDTSSSFEGEKKDGNSKKHDHKDGEHGHRKILVLNKKKKPPLPSFIFLPNIGTPFFSPIGLAPPPMPMYPMVPVPPMPVPPFMPPFPGPPVTSCSANKSSEATPQKPEEKETEPTTSASNSTSETTPETPTNTTASNSKTLRKLSATRIRKRGRNIKQLLQLQQLNALKQLRKHADATSPDDLENFDSPLLAENPLPASPDTLTPAQPPPTPPADDTPPENVDFQYLAQLIHKMDSNNNKTAQPPKPDEKPIVPSRRYGGNPLNNYYKPPPPGNSINTHRNFDNYRHLETPDESYYMNLGHQIASLIRKIDATGEQGFNIEVERQRTLPPPPVREYQPLAQNFDQTPVIMERGYTPRSYWERSVRSLLKHLQPDNEYDLQNSRENNLFNLERRVETIATTTRSLSLNDLENVVYLMDKFKSKLRRPNKNPETTTVKNDDNLNVNLLPHLDERTELERKNTEYGSRRVLPAQLSQVDNRQTTTNKNNDSKALKRVMIDNNINLRGVILQNFQPVSRFNLKNNNNAIKYSNKVEKKELPSLKLQIWARLAEKLLRNEKRHQNVTDEINNKLEKLTQLNQRTSRRRLDKSDKLAEILSNADIYRKNLARTPVKNLRLPRKHSYQSNQVFVDNSNRYLHHKESIFIPRPAPVRVPARRYGGGVSARYSRPTSYFHHELQHLDMF